MDRDTWTCACRRPTRPSGCLLPWDWLFFAFPLPAGTNNTRKGALNTHTHTHAHAHAHAQLKGHEATPLIRAGCTRGATFVGRNRFESSEAPVTAAVRVIALFRHASVFRDVDVHKANALFKTCYYTLSKRPPFSNSQRNLQHFLTKTFW